jgi:hypothetical protein
LTLDIEGLVQHYRDQLRTVIEGRRWIVATDVLIGGARLGKVLQQLGAEQVLCLATSRGVGDLPESEDLQCIEMGLSGHTDMMEAIRASGRALTQLPDWFKQRSTASIRVTKHGCLRTSSLRVCPWGDGQSSGLDFDHGRLSRTR